MSTETFHQLRRPMTRQWQKVVNYLQQKFHVSTVIHTHTRERERERAESSQKSKTLFFPKKKKNGNQPGTEKIIQKKKARKSIWSLFSLVDFELFRCYNLHPFLFVSLGDGVICVSSFWLSMKNAAYVHWIHIFFCFKLFCRSRGRPDY